MIYFKVPVWAFDLDYRVIQNAYNYQTPTEIKMRVQDMAKRKVLYRLEGKPLLK